METDYCPHCGAKHYMEELNFTLLQNINGYKIDCDSVIIEQSVKRIKSNFTQKCVSCGYQSIHEIKH